MNEVYLKARAKINLALDIIGKREDGYHEMNMIMQTLKFHDVIYIKQIDTPKIILSTNHQWLPLDNRNLVYQAADILLKDYHINKGLYIEIKKSIPMSAGLAGGSSDCAATLVGIRSMFKLPVDDEKLREIGKTLGADVPYCLMRGTVQAQGIGEQLTKLPPHPETLVLLVKPPIKVSTANVFKVYNPDNVKSRPDIESMIEGIKEQDIGKIVSKFGNVLESVTETTYPIIGKIKKTMLETGAIGALMSGSGPTVFGFYNNSSDIKKTIKRINELELGIREIFSTSIYNPVIKN